MTHNVVLILDNTYFLYNSHIKYIHAASHGTKKYYVLWPHSDRKLDTVKPLIQAASYPQTLNVSLLVLQLA